MTTTRGRVRAVLTALTLTAAAVLSACAESSPASGPAAEPGTGNPRTDKLAQVLDRGTLVGYAELDYPPQSIRVEGAIRAPKTACGADQMTAAEVTGFDVETTKLVASRLGLEACFVQPSWTEVTAGNWGDRLDIAYGSGSINTDRMTRLWMTQPYYAVPNYYFVRQDSPARAPGDLDGKRIGVCASCSHELYLRGELEIPGVAIEPTVRAPEIVAFETEGPGLAAAAKGDIEAFLCSGPVGQAVVDEGAELRPLPGVAFTYYPSGFVDKSSGLDSTAFVMRVNRIISTAQADGSLTRLSMDWFGTDYVAAAAAFDLDKIGQELP